MRSVYSSTLRSVAFGPLACLAACGAAPVADPFDDTGELVALSGADAGPEAACHTCHGLDGSGDGALAPRIAGLDVGYIVRQLGFYADGQRRHPQMSWLASRLDSAERVAVANYYAQMRSPPERWESSAPSCFEYMAKLYQDGDPDRGLQACASCHGSRGQGVGPGNPSLTNQSARYIAEQLQRWRDGRRYGDAMGAMQKAAAGLRENEIRPLSDYIAGGPVPADRLEFQEQCQ
ncbi:c-type cytochrome [Croceicoccus bisphenolivorans]|uniref:c-type cytochrome n=1 Tax=Croceicoccus bisphenolivorans TaxID=1783232 RepID=UPI0009ED48A8